MNRYVFLFLSLFGGWGVSGVAWAAVTDTLELQAVSVQAIPVTKYAFGQAVHSVDAEDLRRHLEKALEITCSRKRAYSCASTVQAC
ncbi:hypothetical protein [Nitritalea halalkaliphila]|uniref:hypothetical protein n=1 Tax=Nitritalea halalkaliphila TaxID=590849 RepID=UPI00031F7254|nr:hypothetical protein [Nitritalea halalkaliphila]